MADSPEVIEAREKRDDRDFFLSRVEEMPNLIEWANDQIRDDKEVIMKAIKSDVKNEFSPRESPWENQPLEGRPHAQPRWPGQNKLNGILGDALSHKVTSGHPLFHLIGPSHT